MAFSSSASSRTPTSTARNHSESYFPGCRKDANCHCDICIASFNATRDLHSALRFPPKKHNRKPPLSIDPYTPPSTPEPVSSISVSPPCSSPSPPIKPTAKFGPKVETIKKEKGKWWGIGLKVLAVLVGVSVFLAVDLGVLEVVLRGGFEPKLGPEMVRGLGQEVRVLEMGLMERLRVVEWRVKGVVSGGGRVSNCSIMDSAWKLNQEGHHLIFQWRCVIYQTMSEELSVWGSPLQTSGILAAGLSPRTLTLLSGRITEWSQGKLVPTLRTSSNGSSWTLEKWSTAAVQLEGETWVLEYKRSASFHGPGIVQTTWEILRHRVEMMVKKIKLRLLLSRTFDSSSVYHVPLREKRKQFKHPT